MRFSAFSSLIALIATAPAVFASVGVHCGTTDDATLSDCKTLLDPGTWDSAFSGTSSVCHYGGLGGVAYNAGCHGNCCVYVAEADPDKDTTRTEAESLLGCGDADNDAINGLRTFPDGHGVCLSNGNGCGDCFDDSDFSTKRRRYAPTGVLY